jgi:hypothetical protein
LSASQNDNIYAVLAITLSNQKHYVPVNPVSFGGPDDWAAATNMDAMIEGLAGVKNSEYSEAFNKPLIAPRWTTTNSDSVNVTVRFAASEGYVSYKYFNDKKNNLIKLKATTGGHKILFHVLLPKNAKAKWVMSNNNNIVFKNVTVEQSNYVDFEEDANAVKTFEIHYE